MVPGETRDSGGFGGVLGMLSAIMRRIRPIRQGSRCGPLPTPQWKILPISGL